ASAPPPANARSHSSRNGRSIRRSPSSTFGSSSTKSTLRSMNPPRYSLQAVGGEGQLDGERGPPADLGLEADATPVLLHDDRVGDRQPLPRPLAHRLGREERVEDARAHGRGDAAAGVGDGD